MMWLCWIIGHRFQVHNTEIVWETDYCTRCGKAADRG